MKKVIVVGGGFAGVSALKRLAKSGLQLILIDKRKTSEFLPCLPDIIGQRIDPKFLKINLLDLAKQFGFKFLNQEVKAVNLTKRTISLVSQNLSYDYLLLCSGTKTNFFANSAIAKQALKLDSIADAKKILTALETRDFDKLVIIGGGYTGIEIATNLMLYCLRHNKAKPIVIIEKSPSLLGSLPQWIKDYVQNNLTKLNIKVLTSTEINPIPKNSLLIWAAGVKASDYIFKLDKNKTFQGRLKVNQYLKLNENCFAVGDIADFNFNGRPLRMSIQFAIKQGDLAARNILNSISQKSLIKYTPKDLGYIIPMANNRSCGTVLGFKIKGPLASFLHYFMCIFRSWAFKNKLGVIKNLIKGDIR